VCLKRDCERAVALKETYRRQLARTLEIIGDPRVSVSGATGSAQTSHIPLEHQVYSREDIDRLDMALQRTVFEEGYNACIVGFLLMECPYQVTLCCCHYK
jgi:ribosome modulation factor